jgi:hypothetical protein
MEKNTPLEIATGIASCVIVLIVGILFFGCLIIFKE